jgi:hypothetical protein
MPGGVTYIKISKTDKDGTDRSEFIRQLETLRVVYNADDIKEYKIRNVQSQEDSYWCAVSPVSQSNTLGDYSVLDYTLDLNPSIITSSFKTIGFERFFTASYSATTNPLNYFNTTTGAYTLGSLPNVRLQVKAPNISITFSGSNPGSSATATFALVDSASFASGVISNRIIESNPLSVTAYPSSNNISFIGNDSIFWNENNVLFQKGTKVIPVIIIKGTSAIVGDFSWGDLTITMIDNAGSTVDASSDGDNKLTLFEPDGANWDYNDFNPLSNNAEISRLSTQFFDVDYESGLTTPLNFIPIISGTAVHAPVQDSNYASKAWSNLRYNGVRSTSLGFNQNLDLGGFGNIPNVEQNQTFFAYFNSVQNTNPIIKNQTAYNIKYLVDSNGEVYQPSPDTPTLYNLIDSFETDKKATIKTISNSGSNLAFLNDTYPITNVGRLDLILVSETGSQKNDFTSSLLFNYGTQDAGTTDYRFFAARTSSNQLTFPISGDTEAINFTEIYDPLTYFGSPFYVFASSTTGSNGTRVKFNTNLLFYSDGTPQLSIQIKNFSTGTLIEKILTQWTPIPSNELTSAYNEISSTPFQPTYYASISISAPFLDFNAFNLIYVTVTNSNMDYNVAVRRGSFFSSTTEYYNTSRRITSSGNYWITGSNSGTTVLTASNNLFSVYNQGYIQLTPTQSIDFGFPTITTPFDNLKIGDKIRFEYSEDKKYSITEIIPSGYSASGSLCLKLDGTVPIGTQLNHFILYRVVNDGSSIILDVNKTIPGEEFTGILQPQYVSSEVSNNYNEIIKTLTEGNLIS